MVHTANYILRSSVERVTYDYQELQARRINCKKLEILCNKLLKDGTPIGLDCETGYDGVDKAKSAVHPERIW